jgi:hypothetical protein
LEAIGTDAYATQAAAEGAQGLGATGEQIAAENVVAENAGSTGEQLVERAATGPDTGSLEFGKAEDLGYEASKKKSLDLSELVSTENLAKGGARQAGSMAVQKAATPKTTVTTPGEQVKAPNKSADELWAWLNSKKGAIA